MSLKPSQGFSQGTNYERTHRRKCRRHFQLISWRPCWLHEGCRDISRHASHVLALACHRKRAKRVGERHDQTAMYRLTISEREGPVVKRCWKRTPTRFTLLVEVEVSNGGRGVR